MSEDLVQPDPGQAESSSAESAGAVLPGPGHNGGEVAAPGEETTAQGLAPGASQSPLAPAVIHLGADDTLATLMAKLGAASARRVVVALPGGSRLLRREVDAARLRHWVASHGVRLVLVSGSPQVRSLARRYGLAASGSVGAARGMIRRLNAHPARSSSGGTGRGAVRTLYGAKGGWEEGLLLLVLLLGIGLVGGMGASLIMPEATVTVAPAGAALEQQVQLIANPSIELVDDEAAEIPAHLIETELKGEAQVSTLARSDAPDAKATGEAVFVNRTAEAVQIPTGTLVATSTGTTIRFVTTESTSLAPGAMSTARARIEAVNPGPSGNVGPFLINRVADPALSLRVRVANEQPTEGGSVKQVGVVTAADKERLRGMLLQQLHQESLARLGSDLSPEEFLPIESVSVVALDETYDHLLGEATEFLGMTMRVHAEGIVFDLGQAQEIARGALEEQVPEGQALLPESFHAEVAEATIIPASPEEGQYTRRAGLVMKVRGRTEATITPGRVISLIQGRPVDEARSQLMASLPLKQPPQLSVDPEWWGRVPWLPFRIQVAVASQGA